MLKNQTQKLFRGREGAVTILQLEYTYKEKGKINYLCN